MAAAFATARIPSSLAVRSSELDSGGIANYQKLRRELAYLDRKSDARIAKEERSRWKALEKSVRRHPKRDWS